MSVHVLACWKMSRAQARWYLWASECHITSKIDRRCIGTKKCMSRSTLPFEFLLILSIVVHANANHTTKYSI